MRAAAIALLLAVSPAITRADDAQLAEAMRLEAALEYEAALVIVERVIAQGGAGRGELATLHLFAGKLAAGLDRAQIAEEHFRRALALEPARRLPVGTSPKITGPFDAARARTTPLRVSASVEGGVVTIVAEADPLRIVTGIAVAIEEGGRTRELVERQGRRIVLPPGAKATRVRALDPYGNELWADVLTEAPRPIEEPIETPVGPPPPPPPERPFYARPTLWLTTCTLALAAGGVGAWQFRVAQDEWDRRKTGGMTDFSELEAIETRGRRWGLVANVSFGVAAAAGILTIVTAATGPKTPAPVVTASRDAVGLALAGQF